MVGASSAAFATKQPSCFCGSQTMVKDEHDLQRRIFVITFSFAAMIILLLSIVLVLSYLRCLTFKAGAAKHTIAGSRIERIHVEDGAVQMKRSVLEIGRNIRTPTYV